MSDVHIKLNIFKVTNSQGLTWNSFVMLHYLLIYIVTFCSEADIYIKEYLHPLVESGFNDARPLRIYYQYRWRGTVSTVVQKYCTFSEDLTDYATFRSDKIVQ